MKEFANVLGLDDARIGRDLHRPDPHSQLFTVPDAEIAIKLVGETKAPLPWFTKARALRRLPSGSTNARSTNMRLLSKTKGTVTGMSPLAV